MRRLVFSMFTVAAGTIGLTAAAHRSSFNRMGTNSAPTLEHRIPTWVVLDETPGDPSGNPILVRTAGGTLPDLIVVSPQTVPAQLAMAALQLSRIRNETRDVAQQSAIYRVSSAQRRGKTGEDRVAGGVLGRLHYAPYVNVSSVGRVHMIQVYLPDSTLRQQFEQQGRIGFTYHP